VLFEILTGRLAYDFDNGIAPIARHHFEKGTLMEIVDRKIKEETDEHVFSLSKGPDKESLEIFSEIAFRCLAETQVQRPTIDVVINELKRALKCQKSANMLHVVCKICRLTLQLHESAGGLPSLKLSLHSCSLPGSTNAMGIETSIALVLPAREHECDTSFVLRRPPALS
ncbi:hypothetical protein Tco_1171934, partial [Tanacetum coccineum]